MVVAEGVGRALNPDLNMWQLAQPLIEAWVAENLGPQAQLRSAVEDGLEKPPAGTAWSSAPSARSMRLPAAASGCIPRRWPRSPATVTAPPVACPGRCACC